MYNKVLRESILNNLKAEHCFWSFDEESIKDVPDDVLIEKTLVYLDIDDINSLFQLFGYKKVKQVWIERVVTQGEYLFSLNRFLAWYYFHAKRPDAYVKSMETRQLNKLFS